MEVIKPYSTYKDSGIPWLGDVPEHWEVKKLKFLLKLQKGKNPKDFSADKVSLPYLSMEYLRGKNIIKTYVLPQDNLVEVQEDDILVLWDGANAGEILKSKHGFLSSTMAVINFNKNFINKKYFFQFLKSLEKEFKDFSTGTTIPHFNSDILLNNHYCIPTLSEQTAIANFLDYKTAKIDRFIFKKKQLIKLLNEQKAAIINDAVTKGLNPNAKMKPSGIEWLGVIPEHWEVRKLWLLITKSELGGNYSSGESLLGIPLIKMGNLGRGNIKLNKIEFIDNDIVYQSNHILKKDDFLFNTRNSAELVGKVSLWRNELPFALFNSNILKIEFNASVSNSYMNLFFNSKTMINALRIICKGTTSVAAIYFKDLSKMEVCFPNSIDEQTAILSHIEKETAIINKTIATIEKEIALVQEYRTALISEAVTGKIDVREYNVPSFEVNKEYAEIEEEMSLVAEEEINLD